MTTVKHQGDFIWEQVSVLKYKEDGTHFKDITRQILFEGNADLPSQLRYFEIASGGHSTLEQHAHLHVVMIIKGTGKALVGSEVIVLKQFDVVHIPSHTWHQFRATNNESFGFLCLVPVERDKPKQPNEAELKAIKTNPAVTEFIKS
jgi:quercetin dioxygenase-like cupin family protein